MTTSRSWSATLRRVGRLADDVERSAMPWAAELPASMWAVTKATVGAVGAPVTAPALATAAMRTAQAAAMRIEAFPDHLHALAEGRPAPLPGERTLRLPSANRYLITSDLHRCIPGRLDWPRRQRVKELYATVLRDYAERDWHLVENGDVEDFWMVGGSTWGAVYDIAALTERAVRSVRPSVRGATVAEQLDRIVANNTDIYAVLRDGFCEDGRYHRTMGNHDDAYADPVATERLRDHLPGTVMADTILLSPSDATGADGIGGVDAVVSHGHLTDSWNGPGFAALGRVVTWMATGLADLPIPTRSRDAEGLPDEQAVGKLLGGRAPNRLITVDACFGGNRRFDSLDEQRLFARLGAAEPDGGWPWLIHGHTHYPMLNPLDARGEPVRYANSGCGVLEGAFTALEWDGTRPEDPLRLIAWVDRPGERPERIELVADGGVLKPLS